MTYIVPAFANAYKPLRATPLHCIVAILFLFAACNFFQQPKPVVEDPLELEPVEYHVGYIAQHITADLSDSQELYPLPDGFLENFMKMRAKYEGTRPTIAAEFPDEWGVVLIERLPGGYELYQIQSQNREWVYLVITSGYGTQRFLDMLPVAVNLASQTKDVLETEIWATERAADGTFTVTKKYEWMRSIGNVTQRDYEANPQNFLRTTTVNDQYFINGDHRFERIVIEEIPDYSVVIFYYKEEKPEDWDEIVPMLQSFCEDYELLFEEADDNFDQLPIYDYKLNFITELDITSYTDFVDGVIFIKKGQDLKTVPFGSYERLKIEIMRYFKIVES
ncbi:MAG: hypothetical protein FWD09_05710 [Lentimicrobiaceae bacterium]|nr:hypothetical protein [Lentimicrobiaceae bacterium]